MKRCSAGVVIFRMEGERRLYLLLHYPNGQWDLVKGKIEKGEDVVSTAIREAREETGICDLHFVDDFRRNIRYKFVSMDGRMIHKSVVYFLAETFTKNITLSDEHIGYTWMEFEAAMRQITYGNARRVLNAARLRIMGS